MSDIEILAKLIARHPEVECTKANHYNIDIAFKNKEDKSIKYDYAVQIVNKAFANSNGWITDERWAEEIIKELKKEYTDYEVVEPKRLDSQIPQGVYLKPESLIL